MVPVGGRSEKMQLAAALGAGGSGRLCFMEVYHRVISGATLRDAASNYQPPKPRGQSR